MNKYYNGTIIESNGVRTLSGGGIGTPSGYTDSSNNVSNVSYLNGIQLDSAGNLYITTTSGYAIIKIPSTTAAFTFVGSTTVTGSTSGTGTAARFQQPEEMAIDSAGNLYVTDYIDQTVRKITPAGLTTTFAGSANAAGVLNGTGTAARFNYPRGITIDSAGNLYVTENHSHTVRKISSVGAVTSFAGLSANYGSADGTGTAARFNYPNGITIDSSGNVYVADNGNSTIRKITPAGLTTTFAGSALNTGSTDGTGTVARFNDPSRIVVDSANNLYVTDSSNFTIRKITPAGVTTTIAGSAGFSGSTDGTGTAARFNYPRGITIDSQGNLYVADSCESNVIRKITSTGTVTTVLKYDLPTGSTDGTGTAARFNYPRGITIDSSGNLYVADTSNQTIRKITQSGLTTTIAGSATVVGSADGLGTAARFNYPYGVAVDSTGNLYVTDTYNYTIRKITPAGLTTTFAGSAGVNGLLNGTGAAARFNTPQGITIDSAGNLYVAEFYDHVVRKITSAGVVSSFVGLTASAGSADGSGTVARFKNPSGMSIDSAGNLYVADYSNYTIRKVTSAGAVSTFAGLSGNFGVVNGTGTAARFDGPIDTSVDAAGNVYVTDSANRSIRKITSLGVVSSFAGLTSVRGSADGTGTAARFNTPQGITIDSAGNLYVTDNPSGTIRKITSNGTTTTLAGYTTKYLDSTSPYKTQLNNVPSVSSTFYGNGSFLNYPVNVVPTTSRTRGGLFFLPYGITIDSSGNLYVADTNNQTIRKITSAGVVTTFAGSAGIVGSTDATGPAARFNFPQGVTIDSSGNLYVADTINQIIRKITPAGLTTTVAGSALKVGSTDATGTAARFNYPYAVTADLSGNLYVADSSNHTIRKITPAGLTTTVAGSAGIVGSTDATGTAARFNLPSGITIDASNNLYVTDTYNYTIRKITPAGLTTTLAGSALKIGSTDATGPAARFYYPQGITIDASNNLYVTDTYNYTIRKITPAGVTTTVAGSALKVGSTDATGTAARFYYPYAVTADLSGNLYVADTVNHTIRKITSAGVVTTFAGLANATGSTNTSVCAALDCSIGNKFQVYTNIFPNFIFTNVPAASSVYTCQLQTIYDGAAVTADSWTAVNSTIKWAGGTAPATYSAAAGKSDLYTFYTYDGGITWFGKQEIYNAG